MAAEAFAKQSDLICRITSLGWLLVISLLRSSQKLTGVKEVFVEMIQAISSRANLWRLDGDIDANEEDEDSGDARI